MFGKSIPTILWLMGTVQERQPFHEVQVELCFYADNAKQSRLLSAELQKAWLRYCMIWVVDSSLRIDMC